VASGGITFIPNFTKSVNWFKSLKRKNTDILTNSITII
jgi:hypothetical protein